MTEHTPGPWEFKAIPFIHEGSGVVINDFTDHPHPAKSVVETARANARLIAASPDLLAQLREDCEVLEALLIGSIPESERFSETNRVLGNIAATINKAVEGPDTEPDRAGHPDLNATDYREELHRGYPDAGR